MQRIIIFANGDLPGPDQISKLLRSDDFVICADGGTRHALALGRTPNLVIGDMDSIQREHWRKVFPLNYSRATKMKPTLNSRSITPLNWNQMKSSSSPHLAAGLIKPSAILRSLRTPSTPYATFALTMGWRKYLFVETGPKSREEAEIPSH